MRGWRGRSYALPPPCRGRWPSDSEVGGGMRLCMAGALRNEVSVSPHTPSVSPLRGLPPPPRRWRKVEAHLCRFCKRVFSVTWLESAEMDVPPSPHGLVCHHVPPRPHCTLGSGPPVPRGRCGLCSECRRDREPGRHRGRRTGPTTGHRDARGPTTVPTYGWLPR